MKHHILLLFLLTSCIIHTTAQEVTYERHSYKGAKINSFDPMSYQPGFAPKLKSLEAPHPGGTSYRSYLMRIKAESAKKYPAKRGESNKTGSTSPDSLIQLRNFGMMRYIESRDTLVPIDPPGAPLDNTMAISNDGIILGSVNSLLYGYDLKGDSILFDVNRQDYIEFADFANPLSTNSPFDPKLLYDPQEDRFVFTFLTGRNPGNSGIIIGFSSTSDPRDKWNVYKITGNPLKNNTWTDYPAIAITDNELFLTINLLRPNEPWQTGFAGSIIWQIDKYDGYKGEDSLSTNFYSDIRHNKRLIRNLNPIQGGKEIMGPNAYFISNRNFDIQNDSIFLLEVTNTMEHPDTKLTVKVGITDEPYGVPPNGEQENASPVTDSTGFDTNDGRVLGGFLHNDRIQFVANTKNFETGLAAVYHGIIEGMDSDTIKVSGTIISDNELDFGYPNIAFSGKAGCDNEAVIGFNHTSKDVYSGFSAVYYDNEGNYSEVLRLKNGLNYVDDISGPYERWGDYFGIQRVYNDPGKIWMAGFYGNITRRSATWFSEIVSPDSTILSISTDTNYLSANSCDGQISIQVEGGNEPYEFIVNGQSTDELIFPVNTCEDEFVFLVKDKLGCTVSTSALFETVIENEFALFPNPVTDQVNLKFELKEDRDVTIRLYDLNGRLIAELLNQRVKEGLNSFNFSTLPLANGTYVFSILSGNDEILTEKLIKQ